MKRFRHLPFFLLGLALLAGLAVIAVSVRVSMDAPWLGARLRSGPELRGALVTAVDAGGPSATILTPDDVVLRIRTADGRALALEPADLEPDPDVFPSFAALNRFLVRQGSLVALLRASVVILDLEDGRSVRVQPALRRPVSALPAAFWTVNLIGLTAYLIGFAVWSARGNGRAPRMLLGTGVAVLVMTASASVVTCRELAMDPARLRAVQALYHAGNDLFTVFGIALLASFPDRLTRFSPAPLLAGLVLPFWLNERFQWTELPGHTVLFQVPLYFLVAFLVALAQWRRIRHRPADRAAFRWFLLSLFGCVGVSAVIYFVPMVWLGRGVVPIGAGFGVLLIQYFGLALGVLRYRLFDLDRWWFEIWIWFLTGAALLAVDLGLAFFVSLSSPAALILSLLIVGWVYFPARQWLWNRLFRSSRRVVEEVLPGLVAGLLDRRLRKDDALRGALKDFFRPVSIVPSARSAAGAAVLDEGEALFVPSLEGGAFELRYADRGARLFCPADARTADALLEIARRSEDRLRAYERGAREEQERIMRDLHDDVGGRLLSIVHAAPTPKLADLGRDALKSLRDIIYSLSPDEQITLDEALGKWRYECRRRCEQAGVRLEWTASVSGPPRLLSPRQWVNLSRVLHEAVSNAFAHAEPSRLCVDWRLEGGELAGCIRNDGRMPGAAEGRRGKGLRNMEQRMREIGGSCLHSPAAPGRDYEIRFRVPLGARRRGPDGPAGRDDGD